MHVTDRGELDGVRGEVGDDLANSDGVAGEQPSGGVGIDDAETQAFLVGPRMHEFGRRLEFLAQIKRRDQKFELASLHLRLIENVRQQTIERLATGLDQRDHFALFCRYRPARQGAGCADDAIERRADLVAHIGQKHALGVVGALGFVASGFELLFQGLA